MIMATTPPMTIRKSHQSVRSEATPSHLYENLHNTSNPWRKCRRQAPKVPCHYFPAIYAAIWARMEACQ